MTAPSMQERLADELDSLSKAIKVGKLDQALARFADWAKPRSIGASGVRGGGLGDATPEDRVEDHQQDLRAARYQAEASVLLRRLLEDLERANRLVQIATPRPPRQIEGREMLASQVAAAGLCVSCFRHDRTNKQRETDSAGNYYDKEACRRCAGFKREHGIYPPVSLLEQWHDRGKNWTTKMVAEALDRRRAS